MDYEPLSDFEIEMSTEKNTENESKESESENESEEKKYENESSEDEDKDYNESYEEKNRSTSSLILRYDSHKLFFKKNGGTIKTTFLDLENNNFELKIKKENCNFYLQIIEDYRIPLFYNLSNQIVLNEKTEKEDRCLFFKNELDLVSRNDLNNTISFKIQKELIKYKTSVKFEKLKKQFIYLSYKNGKISLIETKDTKETNSEIFARIMLGSFNNNKLLCLILKKKSRIIIDKIWIKISKNLNNIILKSTDKLILPNENECEVEIKKDDKNFSKIEECKKCGKRKNKFPILNCRAKKESIEHYSEFCSSCIIEIFNQDGHISCGLCKQGFLNIK